MFADKLLKLKSEQVVENNASKVFESLKSHLEYAYSNGNDLVIYSYENKSKDLDLLYREIDKNFKELKDILKSEGLDIQYSKDNSYWEKSSYKIKISKDIEPSKDRSPELFYSDSKFNVDKKSETTYVLIHRLTSIGIRISYTLANSIKRKGVKAIEFDYLDNLFFYIKSKGVEKSLFLDIDGNGVNITIGNKGFNRWIGSDEVKGLIDKVVKGGCNTSEIFASVEDVEEAIRAKLPPSMKDCSKAELIEFINKHL